MGEFELIRNFFAAAPCAQGGEGVALGIGDDCALLLAGIRCARLWRQLGGHRWQLVISRRKLLKELYPMLRGN